MNKVRTKKQIRETRNGVLIVLYRDYNWQVPELAYCTGLSAVAIYGILESVLRPKDRQWNNKPFGKGKKL